MKSYAEKKNEFIEKLNANDIESEIVQGVSFALDCIHKNDETLARKAVVICSYQDDILHSVPFYIRKFLVENCGFPEDGIALQASHLFRLGNNTEEALQDYCNILRRHSPREIYVTDHISNISAMPDNSFYVLDFNTQPAAFGLHKKGDGTPSAPPADLAVVTSPDEEKHSTFFNIDTQGSLHDMYYKEAYHCLVRPIFPPIGHEFDDVITIDSALWQKEACVALRRFQSKECHDGFRWDSSDEGWYDTVVHPLFEWVHHPDRDAAQKALIGYVVFGLNEAGEGKHVLANAYLHPFFRGERRMATLWPTLKKMYGDFIVDQPNHNMRGFMKKVG